MGSTSNHGVQPTPLGEIRPRLTTREQPEAFARALIATRPPRFAS
jgi:hypothetical protein